MKYMYLCCNMATKTTFNINKCNHDENRRKVCGLCGRKIVFGKSKPTKFLITDKMQKLIQKFILEDFSVVNPRFPLAVCNTCRITLNEREKGNCSRPLPKMPNFAEIKLPKTTRNKNDQCNCFICLTGRFKGHVKVEKGRGHVRAHNVKIDSSTGLYGSSNQENLLSKRSTVLSDDASASKKLNNCCAKCFQETGKGINHPCTSSVARLNVEQFLKVLPEKQQQQVVTSSLKRFVENNNQQNIHLNLATRGPTARVVLNPKIKTDVLFPMDRLDNYQIHSGASSSQMKKLTNFLRCQAGKKSVPIHYMNHVSKVSTILASCYKDDILEFEVEGKNKKERRPVVWADAEELLLAVLKERNQIGIPTVKVMADGGQGFLKISMTVLPENYSPDLNRGLEESEEIEENELFPKDQEVESKRSRYSDGGSVGKKGKLTGIHRLIMLCIVPQIKETYNNIQLMFALTNINNISFKFVSDFKILLLINGQQTATATYPCPYCFITLKTLRKEGDNERTSHAQEQINANPTSLKTYGDLKNSYQKFCSKGKQKKLAKECCSTVNLPLFEENDDKYVLEKCIIPELHLLQGFVNHLFWDGLVPLLGRDKALIWPKKLKLIAKNYQGEIFEGNACRKLLKESDALADPEIIENVGLLRLTPFITSFKNMNKVVEKCFTTGKVERGYEKDIEMLSKCFKATHVSETLKIHVLLNHLQDGIKFLKNDGLGLWSEQAGESIHREFIKYWNRYKINTLSDPDYRKNLKKAVTEFSSRHL